MSSGTPIRVTAAVIREGSTVLLARRRPGTHLAGYWEFPGGKIEPGETAEEALARELNEELGLKASVGQFVASSHHRYDAAEIELLAYEVTYSGRVERSDSHDAIRWVAVDEILAYRLAPADVPIAEKLLALARD